MAEAISCIVQNIHLPQMVAVKQLFARESLPVEDIAPLVHKQLAQILAQKVRPGQKIAVTAGSRGIANMPLICKCVVDYLKNQGALPFVTPAMGSHGGATAKGQLQVLAHYGFTEEYLGCPVAASMEVIQVGSAEGYPVYVDKLAAEADGIVVCARVKPHTAFTGPIESGITKMLVIGLGNHMGASLCHNIGYRHFARLLPIFGQAIINRVNIMGAVATVENAYDETCIIQVLPPDEILAKEPQLLKKAKENMACLYFRDYDVLIVDAIGKDISGAGMDPHITGAFATPYASGPPQPQNIAVLDLTEASNGNIIGLGQADVTTERLMKKAVLAEGYPNAVVSNMLSTCKIPFIAANDKEAMQVCVKCCEDIDRDNPKIIRIANTLKVEDIEISTALLAEAGLLDKVKICGEPYSLPFDEQGNLF